ncbi:Uncharacterized protein LSUE1_G002553 [Lachnellula suecica]|uniref:N-acetyltransferase domain-containing protein n=1 Tax=Lachnellula suecica TaxID=602035 RepID=A0A8T9CCV7_9HELO|nr:Uncharacterized protein LSUE1_G002553 [Lachnellula suecica]
MATKILPPITIGSIGRAEQIAHVICKAFAGDALNRAAILSLDSSPNDTVISLERCIQHFIPSIKNKAASGALLVEAGDWAAVALWVPPDVKIPPPNLNGNLSPLIVEYFQKFSEAKKRHLRDRDYWYLNLLGRHPERKDPGAIRALFQPFLLKAEEAGLPTWVEATNDHARDVYIHFGFKVVEEVKIGEGSVDGTGNLVPGGSGVVIYGMIKEPHHLM